MLNAFQTSDFLRGLMCVFDLPENAGQAQIDQLPPEQFLAIYMILGTWERLGVLVFRHEIDLDLVDDAFSGPIIQSWQKLGQYVKEFRAFVRRDTALEWFQRLAERMLERETTAQSLPAYLAHRNWSPKK
jgi:hypothetical protein